MNTKKIEVVFVTYYFEKWRTKDFYLHSFVGLVAYDRNYKALAVEWELQRWEGAGFARAVVFEAPYRLGFNSREYFKSKRQEQIIINDE
jgi:hypothetical protein